MTVRVANIWTHHRQPNEVRVYVGRAYRGYPESPLGNPWRVEDVGREEALARYRTWLQGALGDHGGPQAQEVLRIARLAATEDVVLLCCCHPRPCHADIVAGIVTRLVERLTMPP